MKAMGWRRDWQASARCTVAVRPTLLGLSRGPAGPGEAEGRVVRTAFQGSSSIVLLDVVGTEIVVETLAEERHEAGTAVVVRPAQGAVFAILDD
jgi:ABC-type Fe3+/spermidine/putrescine transport system ATPase subunit